MTARPVITAGQKLVEACNPPETRYVTCDECQGSCVRVVANGCNADGSENNIEVRCPVCKGTGEMEVEVEPVTDEGPDHWHAVERRIRTDDHQ